MELGSWSIIQAPSLLALIPLVVMIVLIFRGKSNVSAIMVGVLVGALLLGQDLGAMAKAFATSLGSSTALIGLIIMMGAGLGVLMSEAGVTHTLVYWIVKRIGVNTQTKGKIALVVVSIIVCGLLGTLGGGNAVIAPIMLPIMASLGVTPTVVATLFKVAGEIGLILGPLTGVTLITMEVTGLSYGELMIQAAIPFAVFWLAGAWVGANRAQKRTFGKEGYALGEDVQHLDQVVITPRQKRTTVAFLISFVLLVGYGIATKQGTNYALMVMIVLAAVVAIFGGIEIDRSVDCITKGVASQANMFLIFVSIDVLLNLVTLGGRALTPSPTCWAAWRATAPPPSCWWPLWWAASASRRPPWRRSRSSPTCSAVWPPRWACPWAASPSPSWRPPGSPAPPIPPPTLPASWAPPSAATPRRPSRPAGSALPLPASSWWRTPSSAP